MNHIRLTDLDELALTVRETKAKSYKTEAIDAYRGGAYRAAIVSTWIAVTFDIISKIHELASQGDGAAKKIIEDLDKAIAAKDIRKLQTLEDDFLNKAHVDFEFLSSQEFTDLSRLKDDRNLCAHPAFVAEDVLFEPEPERVRLHIVHAVKYLLQHQPVQGKSAIIRLIADIKSVSFPNEIETASVFLNAKYLDRAKKVLVQNLIIVFLKALLRGDDPDLPPAYSSQIALTLQAIARKYPDIYEMRMSERLPAIAENLTDSLLPNLFQLLGADPRCWTWIGEPVRIRIKTFVAAGVSQPATRNIIFKAVNVEELKPVIVNAFNSLKVESQVGVIASTPRPEFAERAIQIYSGASSFRGAESLGASVIAPMIQHFSGDDVVKVLETVKQNNQIWDAAGTPSLLEELFDGTIKHISVTRNAWKELFEFLAPKYSWYVSQGWNWSNSSWTGLIRRVEKIGITVPPLSPP
jgi:hypothetical protein